MNGELLTWIFFGGGLGLMILETAVPGGVSFFLGVGGVLVALLRVVGLLMDPTWAIFAWLVLSTALVLSLRDYLVARFGGERSRKLADEDFEAMDQEVEVVAPVDPHSEDGRIRFRGAEWRARTLEGRLPEGARAQIKYRDNLTWIVEPATGEVAEPLESELPSSSNAGTSESDEQRGE